MKRLIPFLFTIMIVTACSEITHNDYTFRGESEHWEAEYAYEGTEKWGEKDGQKTYSNEDSYKFILKYKGPLEELSSLQKIQYKVSIGKLNTPMKGRRNGEKKTVKELTRTKIAISSY